MYVWKKGRESWVGRIGSKSGSSQSGSSSRVATTCTATYRQWQYLHCRSVQPERKEMLALNRRPVIGVSMLPMLLATVICAPTTAAAERGVEKSRTTFTDTRSRLRAEHTHTHTPSSDTKEMKPDSIRSSQALRRDPNGRTQPTQQSNTNEGSIRR